MGIIPIRHTQEDISIHISASVHTLNETAYREIVQTTIVINGDLTESNIRHDSSQMRGLQGE
jgi:hypothetical protein